MKEKPILFSAPMVRAILEGRKTQTRRVVKDKHGLLEQYMPTGNIVDYYGNERDGGATLQGTTMVIKFPYGLPGHRLWVRETVAAGKCADGCKPSEWAPSFWRREQGTPENPNGLWYDADGLSPENPITPRGKWRPSIHMPRWASRIDLEISGVRVERLQSISEADACAEGVESDQGWEEPPGFGFLDYSKNENQDFAFTNPCDSFRTLWQSINGHESWDANPWVWVIEFKKTKPIDTPLATD